MRRQRGQREGQHDAGTATRKSEHPKTADQLAEHFSRDPLPHLEVGQDHGPTTIPRITLGGPTKVRSPDKT